MLLTSSDQKQIQVDKDQLLKYSYFQKIYEETRTVTFDLPYSFKVIERFVDYVLNNKYSLNGKEDAYTLIDVYFDDCDVMNSQDYEDITFSDFIHSEDYLIVIINEIIKHCGYNTLTHPLFVKKQLFHRFPQYLINHCLEKLVKHKIIYAEMKMSNPPTLWVISLREVKYQALKNFFDKIYVNHLQ